MNTAVALVQAYLNVNGYFTVVEHPMFGSRRRGEFRTATDLDVLAFRLPGAGHDVIGDCGNHSLFTPDPALECPSDQPDMIVGEVNEGPARFNSATTDPAVLEVALARFGCCQREQARELAMRLVSHGNAPTPAGHVVRMVAFGASDPVARGRWTTVSMIHILAFLREYLNEHWMDLRHAHFRDTALGFLALMEKSVVDVDHFPE